jgi:hypothetical protein
MLKWEFRRIFINVVNCSGALPPVIPSIRRIIRILGSSGHLEFRCALASMQGFGLQNQSYS